MFRTIGRLGANLVTGSSCILRNNVPVVGARSTPSLWYAASSLQVPQPTAAYTTNCTSNKIISLNSSVLLPSSNLNPPSTFNLDKRIALTRGFHAAGSKVHYLDFRYRFRVNHLRLHILIIRHKKMKKHQRRKFRRKFKFMLEKKRMKREIAKEKTFRVELLSMIRKAENFDAREYALKCIAEINKKPKVLSREEQDEELKELIRKHRYQVTYIKPKHRRAEL